MAILEIIGTILGGGLTGVIGSAITSILNYKQQKAKNQHEIDLIKAQSDAAALYADSSIKITKAETEGKIAVAELKALRESYKEVLTPIFKPNYMDRLMDGGKFARFIGSTIALMFGTVDFIKTTCRPVLTYYLIGASTWVTVLAYGILKDYLGADTAVLLPGEAATLFRIAMMTILYMTITALSWWFCDRRTAKFANRLMDGNIKDGKVTL